jgi:hypothetical protein
MAEGFVDTFKTELIADRVWQTRTQLELAIVEWVARYNTQGLHESLGGTPPAEHESATPPCALQRGRPQERAAEPYKPGLRGTRPPQTPETRDCAPVAPPTCRISDAGRL